MTERRPKPARIAIARASPARQLAGFIAKFDPPMASRIRSCRLALRRRWPTANELVWDNYNFFVIGYSPTERPSDSLVSLAANAKGVGLSFYRGSTLPDPHGVLQGAGAQNRFVRLPSAKTLTEPPVVALMVAAQAQSKIPMPATGGKRVIIRSVSVKQRPRRA